MSNANRRKRCPQCGQVKVMKAEQNVCSVPCEITRRREQGLYKKLTAASHAAYTKRAAWSLHAALKEAGANDAVIEIAKKAKRSAYETGRQAGVRLGWAKALGEYDKQEWRGRGRAEA